MPVTTPAGTRTGSAMQRPSAALQAARDAWLEAVKPFSDAAAVYRKEYGKASRAAFKDPRGSFAQQDLETVMGPTRVEKAVVAKMRQLGLGGICRRDR